MCCFGIDGGAEDDEQEVIGAKERVEREREERVGVWIWQYGEGFSARGDSGMEGFWIRLRQ